MHSQVQSTDCIGLFQVQAQKKEWAKKECVPYESTCCTYKECVDPVLFSRRQGSRQIFFSFIKDLRFFDRCKLRWSKSRPWWRRTSRRTKERRPVLKRCQSKVCRSMKRIHHSCSCLPYGRRCQPPRHRWLLCRSCPIGTNQRTHLSDISFRY